MTHTTGAMRWAANFAVISAGLHLLALVTSAFSIEAWQMLPYGVVYAALAYGLLRGWRWVGYIAFIALLIGTSVAVSQIWVNGDVPWFLFVAIAIANILAVLALFGALWKSQPATT